MKQQTLLFFTSRAEGSNVRTLQEMPVDAIRANGHLTETLLAKQLTESIQHYRYNLKQYSRGRRNPVPFFYGKTHCRIWFYLLLFLPFFLNAQFENDSTDRRKSAIVLEGMLSGGYRTFSPSLHLSHRFKNSLYWGLSVGNIQLLDNSTLAASSVLTYRGAHLGYNPPLRTNGNTRFLVETGLMWAKSEGGVLPLSPADDPAPLSNPNLYLTVGLGVERKMLRGHITVQAFEKKLMVGLRLGLSLFKF